MFKMGPAPGTRGHLPTLASKARGVHVSSRASMSPGHRCGDPEGRVGSASLSLFAGTQGTGEGCRGGGRRGGSGH